MAPWLVARARATPDADAVETADARLRFADLAARSDAVARRLARRGVAPGDHVAVLGEPTIRTIEIIHALPRLGAVFVPIGTRLARPEARRLLAFARPALVLCDARHRRLAPAGALDMHAGIDALEAARPTALRDRIDPEGIHSIVFTSGTTGTPKGAVLTHGAHHASAVASADRLGTTTRDRWLLCMPLAHVGGLSVVLRSAITGFALVLEERFDAPSVLAAIRSRGVTTISVVPTMLARLLDVLGSAPLPPHLRCVLTGGGPLPPAVRTRATAAGVPLATTYGLTEAASQVATARPGEPGAHPLAGTAVRILAPDAEGIGEVLVRGPTVMRGYHGNTAATAAALRDGWLHTGDLGRLTRDGLVIVGRRDDVIVTGGEKVLPAEVEAVLCRHPAVADAAVWGVPDDHWGARVLAAVVPAGDAIDAGALRAWCRRELAAWKVPAAIHPVPTLPRTASGKLRRGALRLPLTTDSRSAPRPGSRGSRGGACPSRGG